MSPNIKTTMEQIYSEIELIECLHEVSSILCCLPLLTDTLNKYIWYWTYAHVQLMDNRSQSTSQGCNMVI